MHCIILTILGKTYVTGSIAINSIRRKKLRCMQGDKGSDGLRINGLL